MLKFPVLVILINFFLGGLKFFFPGDWVYIADYAQRVVILSLLWPDREVLFRKLGHLYGGYWLVLVVLVVYAFY